MTDFQSMKFRYGPMKPGEILKTNESIVSNNHVFELRYQEDGNLVLYAWSSTGKRFVWHTQTNGKGPGTVEINENGELVIVGPDREVIWTGTPWKPLPPPNDKPWPAPNGWSDGVYVQDDGNVVSYAGGNACWATNTLEQFNSYALLIGVEDYSTFDSTNKKNLHAGCNDVLAMWTLCRRLGYKPENIRVCTTPVLTVDQLAEAEADFILTDPKFLAQWREKVMKAGSWATTRRQLVNQLKITVTLKSIEKDLGDATSGNIIKQVAWLSEKLQAPFVKNEGYLVPGILYYSGHGARVDAALALCPSDVKEDGGRLKNTVKFSEIEEKLTVKDTNKEDDKSPLQYLTVLLDCCGAAAADATQVGLRESSLHIDTTSMSTETVEAALKTARESKLGRRTFCGSRADEQGQQALLDGRWRGAFTWAFCRALEQWKVGAGSNLFTHFDVSHMELLFRTRMQLEALGFSQHPVLLDSISNTPVFWAGMDRVDGTQGIYPDDAWMLNFLGQPVTVTKPNAERDGIQMDTGGKFWALYTMKQGTTIFAHVLVVGLKNQTINGRSYRAGTEYWSMVGAPNADAGPITLTSIASNESTVKGFPLNESKLRTTDAAASWETTVEVAKNTNYWKIGDYYMSWDDGPIWWKTEETPSCETFIRHPEGSEEYAQTMTRDQSLPGNNVCKVINAWSAESTLRPV